MQINTLGRLSKHLTYRPIFINFSIWDKIIILKAVNYAKLEEGNEVWDCPMSK